MNARKSLSIIVALIAVAAACGGSSTAGGGSSDPGAPLTAAECATYAECDVDTSCQDGTTCTAIDDCATPICIASDEACTKRCGTRNCAILESYPVQIACEGGAGGAGGHTGGSGGAGAQGGSAGAQGGSAGAIMGTGGTGGARTCEDVRDDIATEVDRIQSCEADAECGQVLEGTSCGCTRNLVARNDASADRLYALLSEQVGGEICGALAGTCDCPAADGFVCESGRCAWNYTNGG